MSVNNTPKPKQLSTALNLLFAAIALGIVNSVISEITTDTKNLSSSVGLFSTLFSFAFILFFIYNINLGKKWARTTFLVLFILGLLMLPFSIAAIFKSSKIVGTISIIIYMVQIVALIMMFGQECNQWFNNQSKSVTTNYQSNNPPQKATSITPKQPIYNGGHNATNSSKNNPIINKNGQNKTSNSNEYQSGNPYS